MSAAHFYVFGVMAVFIVALVPCWIHTYEPLEHIFGWVLTGRTIWGNAFAIPILGTLKAAAVAIFWPVVLPIAGVLWFINRR